MAENPITSHYPSSDPSPLGSLLPLITVVSPNRALFMCLSHVMDWILVSPHPRWLYWNPTHDGNDGNGRWGLGVVIRMRWGHAGGAPSMGLVSLEESREHLLPPSALWVRIQHWCKLEKSSHQSPTMLAPSTHTSSRMVRNKCLLFISHQVYGTLSEQTEQTKTPPFSLVSITQPKQSVKTQVKPSHVLRREPSRVFTWNKAEILAMLCTACHSPFPLTCHLSLTSELPPPSLIQLKLKPEAQSSFGVFVLTVPSTQ